MIIYCAESRKKVKKVIGSFFGRNTLRPYSIA